MSLLSHQTNNKVFKSVFTSTYLGEKQHMLLGYLLTQAGYPNLHSCEETQEIRGYLFFKILI